MSEKIFHKIHSSNLIYNFCWEDPRLDRKAMELNDSSKLLMITSAGCNSLDYLLDGPEAIHCVDMNPAQNALLELKIAAIKVLDYEDYFQLIGRGGHAEFTVLLHENLKPYLSNESFLYWHDRSKKMSKPGAIVQIGTCGFYAKMMRRYFKATGLHGKINEIFQEPDASISTQRFETEVKSHRAYKLALGMMNLSKLSYLVGVPPSQFELLEKTHDHSLSKFVENMLRGLAAYPDNDNYFYEIYLNGEYTFHAMPDYLRAENFLRLRERVDRVTIVTGNLAEYAQRKPEYFTHMVLLDHMDWLASRPDQLYRHFEILTSALATSGRAIWRSAGTYDGFLAILHPVLNGVYELNRELAEALHFDCRVKSYGSFFIADKVA